MLVEKRSIWDVFMTAINSLDEYSKVVRDAKQPYSEALQQQFSGFSHSNSGSI